MILKEVDISLLKAAPYNPRVVLKPGTKRFEKLKRSLEEYDLVQPIVWNEQTGHIVGGHQRVEVLRHLGHASVPVVVVNLNLEKEQSLNITLNNQQVGGDWDHDKLVGLLEELAGNPGYDLSLTGFDLQELQDLCYRENPEYGVAGQQSEQVLSGEANDSLVKLVLEIPVELWQVAEGKLNELLELIPVRMVIQK